jgi:hypothetical protein
MLRKNPGFEDVTKKFLNGAILLDPRFGARPREWQAFMPLDTEFFG